MVTLFDKIPQTFFIVRLMVWTAIIAMVMLLLTGIFSKIPAVSRAISDASVTAPGTPSLPYTKLVARFYRNLGTTWTHIPQLCLWSSTSEEFQAKQCQVFWRDLTVRSAVGGIPILMILAFVVSCMLTMRGIYKQAQRKARRGTPDFIGKLQYKDSIDLFGKLYGFKVYWIELSDKTQVKVYYPDHFPKPKQDQTLVAFQVSGVALIFGGIFGDFLGTERNLAMPYNPHVAIIRGV